MDEYGVRAEDEEAYLRWLDSHQPFHWFVEFYGIMHDGGFDVIIGNPPYVEYSKIRNQYAVRGYVTLPSGNLFALMVERSLELLGMGCRIGMVLPVSAVCTDRTTSFQTLVASYPARWCSTYDIFPARVFEGAAQRLTILIASNYQDVEDSMSLFTSRYMRWYQQERPALMSGLSYRDIGERGRRQNEVFDRVNEHAEFKVQQGVD